MSVIVVLAVAGGFAVYYSGKNQNSQEKPASNNSENGKSEEQSQGSGGTAAKPQPNQGNSQGQAYKNDLGYEVSVAGNLHYRDITSDIRNDQSLVGHGGGPTPKNEVIFSDNQDNLSLDAVSKENYSFTISVYENANVEMLLGAPIDSQYAHFSKQTIGGVSWTKEEMLQDPDKGAISLAVAKSGLTYSIHITGKVAGNSAQMSQIDQMLGSFKFTK